MTERTYDRIVVAAGELTAELGWSAVTMTKLAERAGVSRQTVYNEVGSKSELGEALVMRELIGFLDVVEKAFADQPHDVVEALRAAAYGVLRMAPDNALLQAIVSASHGGANDLLPLLTTRSDALVGVTKDVLGRRLRDYEIGMEEQEFQAAVDMLVRVVLSHVMHPTADPQRTADDIAWLGARVLVASPRTA